MPGGWAGSDRKSRLPADWASRIVPAVKRRDRVCQWRLAVGGICGQPGSDVDHINDPGDHSLDNLQLLCKKHHGWKSSAEGRAGRTYRRGRRRAPEPHPGVIEES